MTTPDEAPAERAPDRTTVAAGPLRGTLSAGLSFGAASFVGTTTVGLFTSIFIARLYGVRAVGQFALVYAPVLAVWLLSTVREQPALQREAAVLPPRDPRVTGLFAAVFTFSTALTVAVSGIAAIVTILVFQGPIKHPGLIAPALASLGGYTLFTNTCWNFDSIFIAFRDGRQLLWLRLHQALVYLVLIVAASVFSRSVWSLVVATACSWFFPCIHRLITVRKWMRFVIPMAEVRRGFGALGEMLRFGLKLTPGGLIWGGCDQIGTWVLGSLSTIAAVGAYNRAWFIGQRFLDARLRLSELLFPTLVERRSNRDQAGYDRALIDSLRYAIALMLWFAAVGGGAAASIMAVFGPGFGRASSALTYLLLVPVSTTIVSVLSQSLIADNRPLATSITASVRLLATFPAVVILTHQFGITGTAVGMAVGAAAQLVCQLAVTQRSVLRLFPALWPRRQMCGQIAAYAAGFAVARATIVALPGYAGLPVALATGTIGYFAALVVVGGLLERDRARLALARGRICAVMSPARARVTGPATLRARSEIIDRPDAAGMTSRMRHRRVRAVAPLLPRTRRHRPARPPTAPIRSLIPERTLSAPPAGPRSTSDVLFVLLSISAAAGLLAIALTAGMPVLLGLMATPAVATGAYLLWRVDPAYTFSVAIFLSPIAGNWQELGFPTGLDPDRIMLTFAIIQVLFRAPAVRDRPRFKLTPAHVLLGLAVFYALSSAFFAKTLFVKVPLFKIIDSFGILPFLTFLTAPLAFRTPRHRAILLLTLVVLGAYLGLTVWFETVHLNALIYPRYILNPHYGIHFGRGRGPFVEAVANGFALFVCATACGVAIATWSRRWARLLAALVGLLCLVGSFLSLERSVWIGVGAACIITMLAIRRLRPYFVPVAAVLGIGVVAALTMIPGLSASVSERANLVGTIYDRENLTVAAINMIKARPLTGFGWQRFQDDSLLYFRQNQNFPLTATKVDVHNFFLSYAVELGLPGLALWAFGLLMGVGSALLTRGPPDLGPWRVALLGTLISFAVVSNSVPPSLFPNLSLWLLAGVAFSGRYARAQASSGEEGAYAAAPVIVGVPAA